MRALPTLLLLFFATGIDAAAPPAVEARVAVLREQVPLEPDEAERFWPLYRRYAEEKRALQQRRADAIERSLDGKKMQFYEVTGQLQDWVDLARDEFKLRKAWLPRFEKALPPRKLLRLLRLEERLDLDWRRELLREIPTP